MPSYHSIPNTPKTPETHIQSSQVYGPPPPLVQTKIFLCSCGNCSDHVTPFPELKSFSRSKERTTVKLVPRMAVSDSSSNYRDQAS
jgi:hypothetical protein